MKKCKASNNLYNIFQLLSTLNLSESCTEIRMLRNFHELESNLYSIYDTTEIQQLPHASYDNTSFHPSI